MLKPLPLAVLLILILPLTAAAVASAGAAGGLTADLKGTGTASDPFMVSSADDLRAISDSHHYHEGAYYKQTRDIIFDDRVIGDRITMNISVKGNDVIVTLITQTSAAAEYASAYVSFNDSVTHVDWVNRFNNAYFSINEMKDVNSIIAAGSVNGKHFAIMMEFSSNDAERSVSASFGGNFTPIGSREYPFSGFYDGNGYSITGIKVASAGTDEQCAGLFGYTDEATVFNLRISSKKGNESYFITNITDGPHLTGGSEAMSESFAGSIIGRGTASSSIMFCYNDAPVSSVSIMGGLPAVSDKEELNIYSYASSYAGGLTGFGTGKIFCSENSGNVASIAISNITPNAARDVQKIIVSSTTCSYLGGIIGYSDGSYISVSGNSGDVSKVSGIRAGDPYLNQFADNAQISFSGTLISIAGGIAGLLNGGEVTDVHNAGYVSFKSAADGTVNELTESTNVSNILLRLNTSVGGIYGVMGGTSAAERVCASGNISVSSEFSSLQADKPIRIEFSEDTGKIAGTVIGNSASMDNCYYRSDMKNYPVIGSGGNDFKAKPFNLTESYESVFDLDFERTWSISDTGHPVIWIRYDMMIIDVSENFQGSAKYSVDREYVFDGKGTLFSYVDKGGFSLNFADGYGDDITIYTFIDGKKIILEPDENNHYMISSEYLLRASSGLTLYIDGFAKMPSSSPEPGSMVSAVFSVLIAFVMAVSVYNTRFATSMLRIYDRTEQASNEEGKDEQT
ncbi:MAG: hypothetical protein FWD92_06860 [Methanomassiliicoccaceae archaeon]|nr:hypothetical protein [Methanomassiliicoccaceae archaeon]